MPITFGGNPTPSDVARATEPNTFTQNQTLEGTNNIAPNQNAESGTSIMTRDLTDARYGDFDKTVTITSFGGALFNSIGSVVRNATPTEIYLRAYVGNTLSTIYFALAPQRLFQWVSFNEKLLWKTKMRYDALVNISGNCLDSSMNFFVPFNNNNTSNPYQYPGTSNWNTSNWGYKIPVYMFYNGYVNICLFEHFRELAVTRTTNVVSLTTNMAVNIFPIEVGDLIYIGGANPSSFNTFEPVAVTSVSGNNILTFDQVGSNESVTNAGAALQLSKVHILTSIPLTATATTWDGIGHRYTILSNGQNDATFLIDDVEVASVTEGLSGEGLDSGNVAMLTYNQSTRTNYASFVLQKIRFQLLE